MIERVQVVIDQVRAEFAPDSRTAIFEIDALRDGEALVLYGASSQPAAVEALHARAAAIDPSIVVRDEVVRLPVEGTEPMHAIVSAATAPMLAGPIISESHLAQLVLGHRVLILREHGRWLQCRATDGYIGWIHRGYLCRVLEVEARAWEIGASRPVFYSLGVEIVDENGRCLIRLPWGARFGLRKGLALLPDGREGRVQGAMVAIAELPLRFPPRGDAVVATARKWMGAPYLWGGTTPWGVDCSGFVQSVFRTHGIELPRDSDQQALVGERIDVGSDFNALQPGDLLFFAEEEDQISHVAISTGGSGILHSAVGRGGVSTNDLLGEEHYERDLRQLLVAARRVISAES